MDVIPLDNKPIFSDTDCLSCFISINRTDILEKLFDNIIIPQFVYEEFAVASNKNLIKKIDELISKEFLEVKNLTTRTELMNYINFKKNYSKRPLGKGEASAITLAIMYNGIIASNNTRDVIVLVKEYDIEWIKTGDILKQALDKKIISIDEGDIIWKKMLKKGRYLGKYVTLTEYIEDNY